MREFDTNDLVRVEDTRPVEHIGGPNDGDFLPLCGNAARPGGCYVPVNELTHAGPHVWRWVVVGMRFVRQDSEER